MSRNDDAANMGHLIGMMKDGPDKYITGMEQEGIDGLITRDLLPTTIALPATREQFEMLGFKFFNVVEADPLFQVATIPDGWSKHVTSRLWIDIRDERGLGRAAVFYKAAFYDRKASMSLSDVPGGIVSAIRYYEDTPGCDGAPTPDNLTALMKWSVLTDEERSQVLAGLIRTQGELKYDIATHTDPDWCNRERNRLKTVELALTLVTSAE